MTDQDTDFGLPSKSKARRRRKPSRPVRSPAQLEYDRTQISRLFLQQKTVAQIASEMNLSPQQVQNDLRMIRDEWRRHRHADLDERMAMELARIDRIEAEAWTAWEASWNEISSTTQYAKPDKDGTPRPVQAVVHKSEGRGNPQYLQIIQWCVEQRARLLGLTRPDVILQQNTLRIDGLTQIVAGISGKTDAELQDEVTALLAAVQTQTDVLNAMHDGQTIIDQDEATDESANHTGSTEE